MEKTRIATINQGPDAGKRYVVQRIHFGMGANDPDKVYCWGEVVKVVQKGRALQTTHANDSRTFLASAVTVTEVDRSPELLNALFRQQVDGLRAKGHVLEQRGRTVIDHGTPEQVERRREADERLKTALDEMGLGALFRGRRQ